MSEVTIDTGPLKGAMLQSKGGAEVRGFLEAYLMPSHP